MAKIDDTLQAYAEYVRIGGTIAAIDDYWDQYEPHIPDEDGELAYERMLSDKASIETDIDAMNGC